MLENNPYYLEKEAQWRTGKTMAAANREQLVNTTRSKETSDSNSNLDYHQTNEPWWARALQNTYRWLRPSNT